MRICLLFVILLFSLCSHAQGEANNWYFGDRAGVSFNSGAPVAVTDGVLSTLEGCSSISDASGQLLFYTDGITVWNRDHTIMLNGTGLKGDPSSTSSGLIVPRPESPGIYFIFTVDEPHHFNTSAFPSNSDGDGVNDGLNYSVVDMSLDDGLGGIVTGQKNIHLVTYDPSMSLESELRCSEKITAVKSNDCKAFWLITHFKGSFYSFRIDINGVDPAPVVSTVGPEVSLQGYRRNALGYIKASPDGTKIGVCHFGFATTLAGEGPGKIMLHDFDDVTGVVSNSIELRDGDGPYGVEFSADSNKLYATFNRNNNGSGNSVLVQFDLQASNIPASQIIINESSVFSGGALQLGPDGKIYQALFSFGTGAGNYLGVIDDPEEIPSLVNYTEQGVLVNIDGARGSRIGLPPFIQSIFVTGADIVQDGDSAGDGTDVLGLCTGDSYTLQAPMTAGATYSWTLDNAPLSENDFDLVVNSAGTYIVNVDPNNGDCPTIGQAIVTYYDLPMPDTPGDLRACDTGNDGMETFDLQTDITPQLNVDSTVFEVTYHTSPTRDQTDIIADPSNYTNTLTTETIYVKIANRQNINCDDTSIDFQLHVDEIPEPDVPTDFEVCDDPGNDAGTNFDLNAIFLPQLNVDTTIFEVTYHTDPARDTASEITNPSSYNTQPAQTIYFKIANLNNAYCTDETLKADLIIHPAPGLEGLVTMPADRLIEQCDNNNDGISNFNLEEAYDLLVNDGVTNHTLEFYLSLSNAQNNTASINSIYQNTRLTEEVFVRVTSDEGCVNVSNFFIRAVGANLGAISAMVTCEDSDGIANDGHGEFDLVAKEAEIRTSFGLDASISIRFYSNEFDAEVEQNEIAQITDFISPSTTIWVRAEGGTGNCRGIEPITLTVNPLPQPILELEYIICVNEPGNDSVNIDGGTFESYNWVNVGTGASIGMSQLITISESGDYQLTVTYTLNGVSCINTMPFEVLSANIPEFATDPFTVTDLQENNSVGVNLLFGTVDLGDQEDYEYALNSPNGPYQQSNRFDNLSPGVYTVYVRNINGNCAIASKDVSVVGYPKFFTPNGDGFNDQWRLLGVNEQFQAGASIYIFDRYGKLLKQLGPTSPGWDGTFNGHPLPASDYWFRVLLDDGRSILGHFALKR